MDQKWIQMLVILVFYQTSASGTSEIVLKEGDTFEIKCEPPGAYSMVIWFRVLEKSGMEFIASFDMHGKRKLTPTALSSNVDDSKMDKRVLTLKSFNKARDSGAYGCACIKNNELIFGKETRLKGEKKAVVATRAPLVTTGTPNPPVTTKACVCETSPSIYCSTIILGPLAGGCGLLLLLLIITSLYCNQIRTRRCPHHHRRKPRTMAHGKQMKNNTHV
ncbi:T-cell surface glycoprotein CD8 alpha chain [Pleuronectes platessa]|uniref:T-cell surface glycoprotein CD8 alpha chain n=1 Tax=Pleuronectes platessa TaxID=8262 RepID=UPI00232A7A28|nr:T-cell surface glycoprotein CD8 alpha chain [Pleuronectes platessa]